MPLKKGNIKNEEVPGIKAYCGEDCFYVKSLEAGMKDMLDVIKKMEVSVRNAQLLIIKTTNENIGLRNVIKQTMKGGN